MGKKRKAATNTKTQRNSKKQRRPPSPASSTESSDDDVEVHGIRKNIADVKQTFATCIICLHVVILVVTLRECKNGEFATVLLGDFTGDILWTIWPNDLHRVLKSLVVGAHVILHGPTDSTHVKLANTRFNRTSSAWSLERFTLTPSSNTEPIRLPLALAKMDTLNDDYEGPARFDIIVKVVKKEKITFKKNNKNGLRVTIVDDTHEKTVLMPLNFDKFVYAGSDQLALMKNCQLRTNGNYVNLHVGYVLPTSITYEAHSTEIKAFKKLKLKNHVETEFDPQDFVEMPVKKLQQKTDTLEYTQLGKYRHAKLQLEWQQLLGKAETVYHVVTKTNKAATPSEIADDSVAKELRYRLKVQFQCHGKGKRLITLTLFNEQAKTLLNELSAKDFEYLHEIKQQSLFDELRNKSFVVFVEVQKHKFRGSTQFKVAAMQPLDE